MIIEIDTNKLAAEILKRVKLEVEQMGGDWPGGVVTSLGCLGVMSSAQSQQHKVLGNTESARICDAVASAADTAEYVFEAEQAIAAEQAGGVA